MWGWLVLFHLPKVFLHLVMHMVEDMGQLVHALVPYALAQKIGDKRGPAGIEQRFAARIVAFGQPVNFFLKGLQFLFRQILDGHGLIIETGHAVFPA